MSIFIKEKNPVLVSKTIKIAKKPQIFFNSNFKKSRSLVSKKIRISEKVDVLKKNSRQIFLSSSSDKVLLNYWNILENNLKALGYLYISFKLPLTRKRITLLKSPHVHKKAKEQFELVTYKIAVLLSPETNISNIKNIFIKKPASVSFKGVFSDIK